MNTAVNFEKLSHGQLKSTIETELHTNKYEHRESFFKFLQVFILCAFLGLLVGGLFDYIINRLEGSTNNRLECTAWLTLQLLITGAAFYIILMNKKGIPFDDWMMGTFAGFIFALTFFTVQQKLTDNMQCLFQVS